MLVMLDTDFSLGSGSPGFYHSGDADGRRKEEESSFGGVDKERSHCML
jgi:hypothetical protein